MPLPEGTFLGPYEILAPIGAGGMGEVYRARDGRLGREIAVKVSAEKFTLRFAREARAVAALNHPNICHLYDVGPNYLVMELVEGPTLAERIKQGPIPLEEALGIARQIGEALREAHAKNVVHRDLKPGNVKLRPDGTVKVLDFGLAKMTPVSAILSAGSPTISMDETEAGTIMGTPAYMAPEQARGKAVDKRADIWSFGVVLYEMLTGHKLFEGETISDTLAEVLKSHPEWERVPEQVRHVLRQCLEKDAKRRLQDIGDWELLLEEAGGEPAPPQAGHGRLLPWQIAAACLGAAALVLGFLYFRGVNQETSVLKMSVLPPEKAVIAPQSIPAISPDGRRVAFFAGGKLKKIEVAGGPPLTLYDAAYGRGGTWSKNDVILFAPNTNRGLVRVPAAGGSATPVTALDPASKEISHRFPWFLPDGRHFLYTARSADQETTVYVGDLDSKSRRAVIAASSNAVYTPPGYLLFVRERTLMAQPFDAGKAQSTGDAAPIAEQVDYVPGNLQGQFSVSQNGVIAYASGSSVGGNLQLTWFDRSGKATGTVGAAGDLEWPAISPDGNTVAFARRDTAQTGNYDVWVHDLVRDTESRFTLGPQFSFSRFPVWSPDGSHIAFRSNRDGPFDVYQKATSGITPDEALDKDARQKRPEDWSRDGRYIIEETLADPKTGNDIWVLPLSGDKKPYAYVHTEFSEPFAKLSPNGQWLAYQSDETKRAEIYVMTFPQPGGRWQVSTNGGGRPVWSRDGKDLYFIAPDGKMMAAEVKPGAKFEAGVPKALFDTRISATNWFDVSKDGRFLIPVPTEQAASVPVTVVVNWTAGLKK
ncbi:MAG TPA: protein kinase [Bryobacteraceae bacterium]|nr:protein kinase [Bryobacteraceae bacterium]